MTPPKWQIGAFSPSGLVSIYDEKTCVGTVDRAYYARIQALPELEEAASAALEVLLKQHLYNYFCVVEIDTALSHLRAALKAADAAEEIGG